MDSDTVAQIEDWEARPFAGGHAGLRDLADAEFSGAVSAGGAWAFLLNGRVVGVAGGSLESVEGADGTAYEAPHPSLPLLFAMQDRGGETKAQYYTDDTPLSEVDDALSDSGFTGYIELSENVLSGDYYVVYYGGRSLSVAFIGSARRVISGDEAFQKAADEVGIYEVKTVELDVQEIQESADSAAEVSTAEAESQSAGTADDEPDMDAKVTEKPVEGEDTASATASSSESGSVADDDEPPEEPTSDTSSEKTDASDRAPSSEPAADDDMGAGGAETSGPAAADPEPDQQTASRSGGHSTGTRAEQESRGRTESDRPGEDPFSEEEEWRRTRTIPALDPEETEEASGGGAVEAQSSQSGAESRRDVAPSTAEPEQSASPPEASTEPGAVDDGVREQVRDRIAELESAIEAREQELADLQEELESVSAERDSLTSERDRLQQRVEELEARLEAADGAAVDRGRHLEPTEALTQTDLLVRYGSKGESTLEDAHAGSASREEVTTNLHLDAHTRFEAGNVSVDGRPFEDFLPTTVEYQFVEWFVTDLIYELQETGNRKSLRDLYAAIPAIDRAEFRGTVTMEDDEGEEVTRSFDIVMRDRMGQPLVVANVNDARDPATGDMMEDLIDSATVVGDGHDTLGAAFLVTSSFFEPDSLEMATEASGGGLFKRESRKSFVKLSRKRGYHLCLVESRDDTFHVAVPEL